MIKLKSRDLREKPIEDLIKMKEEMKSHLMTASLPKNARPRGKGFNPSEERKNIARINTILNEKKLQSM